MQEIPEAYTRVMRTAFRILSYQDNTQRVLHRKLREKGFTEEECEFAVRYAVQNGYLNEDRQLYYAVKRLADGKLYGRRRILAELYRLGFSRQTVEHGAENGCFDEIDFAANCLRLLQKRGGTADDRTMAFMLRYGYTVSEVRAAQNALDMQENL